MFRKILMPACAALVAATVAALAANTTFFTSIGDQVFPFSAPLRDGTAGAIDNMIIGATTPRSATFTTIGATTLTATEVDAAIGSYANNPASNQAYPSYVFGNSQTQMTFNIGGTTSYAYVTLAPSPGDGQQACLFSTVTITTLYVYANTGQSIANAITSLAANASACYRYSLANTTWYRTR